MKKIVLLVCAILVITAVAADFYGQSRSQPIARPVNIKLQASAPEYQWDTLPDTGQETYWPAVSEYMKSLPPDSSVLDLGCGNGSFVARFRNRGWKLTGVDFSKSGLAAARATWPDIRFELADATEDLSAIGYGSFDAVIATEVIEHVYLPRKFTGNCYRLLKPGGILVMSTPYTGYLKNLAVALLNRSDRYWDPLWDYGHIKFWSVATLSALLFESGFEQLEWRGMGKFPHLWKTMVFRARVPQANVRGS
jgi:SAM-dependent methyltransferase